MENKGIYVDRNPAMKRWYIDAFKSLRTYILTSETESNFQTLHDIENMIFQLISSPESHYGILENYAEEKHMYDTLKNQKLLFFNECIALQHAELQQKAQELQARVEKSRNINKQEQINKTALLSQQFSSSLFSKKFYMKLAQYAIDFHEGVQEYHAKPTGYKKRTSQEWEKALESFCNLIFSYPVAQALLPGLLTSFIVEEKYFDSIYARMKYKKYIFPRNRYVEEFKNQIESLYCEVERHCYFISAVDKGMSENLSIPDITIQELFFLPVMSLASIINKLKTLDLFIENPMWQDYFKIGRGIGEYLKRNGVKYSGKENKDSDSFRFEQIFSSIAKLCNSQAYIYYKNGYIQNLNVKRAILCLSQEKFLMTALTDDAEEQEFLKAYQEFCQISEIEGRYLARLSVHKYFHIPASPKSLSQITFFSSLLDAYRSTSETVNKILIKDFGQHALLGIEQFKFKHEFFEEIVSKFLSQDFDFFVSEEIHFTPVGFGTYIRNYCKQKSIELYEDIPTPWKNEILAGLFEDMLSFINAILLDYVVLFCNNLLEKNLYPNSV